MVNLTNRSDDAKTWKSVTGSTKKLFKHSTATIGYPIQALCIGLLLAVPATAMSQSDGHDDSLHGNTHAIEPAGPTLTEARAGFVTRHVPNAYVADGKPDVPPEGVFDLVYYPSPAGKLAAYLTPDPGGEEKRPALIWAHGGFGGIGSWLWEESPHLDAFRDAGFVIFCPSWRGENNNPGRFELFYGEVEDAVAAVDYVSRLSFVDRSRIYIAGHSTGGTITLLAALSTNKLRAAFSLGGAPDVGRVVSDGDGYGNTPYRYDDQTESRLRSAIHFVHSLEVPTFYFEGSASDYAPEAEQMQSRAEDAGTPFRAFTVAGGNHFNVVNPIVELIARKLRADTDEQFAMPLQDDEIAQAFRLYVDALISGRQQASDTEWEELLSAAIDDDRLSDAMRIGRAAIAAYPDHSEILYSYGLALFTTLQFAESLSIFERAHASAPEDAYNLMMIAYNTWMLRRLDETRSLIAQAHELAPDSPEIIELRRDFEQEQRILNGNPIVPPADGPSEFAHEFLTEFAADPTPAVLNRYIDKESLHRWIRSTNEQLGTPIKNIDKAAEKFITGAIQGMQQQALKNATYRGFEVAPKVEQLDAEGMVMVRTAMFFDDRTDEKQIQHLKMLMKHPELAEFQDEDMRKVLSGLDDSDREDYFRRLVDERESLVSYAIQLKLKRTASGAWRIHDIGWEETVWASQASEIIGKAMDAGLIPPPKPLAYRIGRFIGRLALPLLIIGLIIFFKRRSDKRVRHLSRAIHQQTPKSDEQKSSLPRS